jgi:hypothetical protein
MEHENKLIPARKIDENISAFDNFRLRQTGISALMSVTNKQYHTYRSRFSRLVPYASLKKSKFIERILL